jgi:hypothetical protein
MKNPYLTQLIYSMYSSVDIMHGIYEGIENYMFLIIC